MSDPGLPTTEAGRCKDKQDNCRCWGEVGHESEHWCADQEEHHEWADFIPRLPVAPGLISVADAQRTVDAVLRRAEAAEARVAGLVAERQELQAQLERIKAMCDMEIALALTHGVVSPQRYGRTEFASSVAAVLSDDGSEKK